jgi:hypothetical protein
VSIAAYSGFKTLTDTAVIGTPADKNDTITFARARTIFTYTSFEHGVTDNLAYAVAKDIGVFLGQVF